MGTYDADVASGNNINIDGTLSITTGTFTTNSSTSDIDGTLTINGAGIYDADGTFDATNGTVQFTGSGGTIKLGGETVTSLGNTLTEGTGTIEYDGGAQNVLTVQEIKHFQAVQQCQTSLLFQRIKILLQMVIL